MLSGLRRLAGDPEAGAVRGVERPLARYGWRFLASHPQLCQRFGPRRRFGYAQKLAAILIFAITYLVLAIGRLPGFRIDRTGAAIIGASFMVGVNALSVEDASKAINFDTIILLFGMMIVVVNLRLSGFFSLVAARVVEHAHRPTALLVAIVGVAGLFSAFFVNDTMCLVLTPLVLEITRSLRRNPVPYLLALAMASKIGRASCRERV